MNQKFRPLLFYYLIALLLLFLPALFNIKAKSEPWANHEWKLFIDEATILKGYTVVAGDNDFKLGVRDKAISHAATAVVRELNEAWVPDGPVVDIKGKKVNYQRISPAWEFDFLAKPRIGVLNKPLYVAIKHNNKTMNRKVIHFWDGTSKTWKPLPSSADLKNNLTRAVIHLPYAILATFDISDEYEAVASWYPDKLTPSSFFSGASNCYPIGTYVKVCRLDNLQKCVKVKVVSTGPYVDGRIIDLTKTAFSKIARTANGILPVRVAISSK